MEIPPHTRTASHLHGLLALDTGSWVDVPSITGRDTNATQQQYCMRQDTPPRGISQVILTACGISGHGWQHEGTCWLPVSLVAISLAIRFHSPTRKRRLQDTVREPTSWEGYAVFSICCTTLTSRETFGRCPAALKNTVPVSFKVILVGRD
jgi:hypothetical protein